jgi:hypothetical protein
MCFFFVCTNEIIINKKISKKQQHQDEIISTFRPSIIYNNPSTTVSIICLFKNTSFCIVTDERGNLKFVVACGDQYFIPR